MTVSTALVSGNDPLPQLAEQAISQALAKARLTHANGVLLFLTPEFARHAQATVTAVARAAQSMQVAGGIAAGIFTESGWVIDRPAAGVMVFGGDLAFARPETGDHANDYPILSYASGNFPAEWRDSGRRFGGSYAGSAGQIDSAVWRHSRLVGAADCSLQLLGGHVDIGVSSGLQLLSDVLLVEKANGFDLERLGGQTAIKSLHRRLPPELREFAEHAAQNPQLHQLFAVLIERELDDAAQALISGRYRPIAIIAVNPDHSLTLAEHVTAGQRLVWAMRRPTSAEIDMRQTISHLRQRASRPDGALVFSCIGRGPYFYSGDDRDLIVLRERYPNLPILGTYGTGQIAPTTGADKAHNRVLQNSVVTAFISTDTKKNHV